MRPLSFSGKDLKWIALCSMLLDHIGFLLVPAGPLYVLLRTAGRLAFPLFCFLLTEGFLHTGNRAAYGKKLFLFALLSELPFNLACGKCLLFPDAQNVFFTLFLGLCMMSVLSELKKKFRSKKILSGLSEGAAVCFFAVLSWLLRCDYQAYGIFLIALLYWYRTGTLSIAVPAFFGAFLSLGFYCSAALSMIFIYYYDGTRGNQRHPYFYYLFYPIHLLILSLPALWLR